jgi:hypothetical protein
MQDFEVAASVLPQMQQLLEYKYLVDPRFEVQVECCGLPGTCIVRGARCK